MRRIILVPNINRNLLTLCVRSASDLRKRKQNEMEISIFCFRVLWAKEEIEFNCGKMKGTIASLPTRVCEMYKFFRGSWAKGGFALHLHTNSKERWCVLCHLV